MECCVIGCSGVPSYGIQGFYNFPQDNHRKLEWLNAIGRLEEEINVLSALCSSHFTEECFEFTPQGMLLKTDATPEVKVFRRERGINDILNKPKHSAILVSSATIKIQKIERKAESDFTQIDEQSQMNIIEKIIKEFNAELSKKKHLYILESTPEKIKEDLRSIRSNGYNMHLRDDVNFQDQNDDHHNNGYDSDTIDMKDNILQLKEDPNNDSNTEYQLNPTLLPESKTIIYKTLQEVLDSETPDDSYVLILNKEEKEPEKEKETHTISKPTPRRRKRKKQQKISSVSDTVAVHILTAAQQVQRIKDALESNEFLKNPFRCYKCGISFLLEYHYRQHMIRHDKSYGPVECTVCNSYFPTKKILITHQTAKHRFLFRCKACEFATPSRAKAKEHGCSGTVSTTFQCGFCHQRFSKAKSLYSHKHMVHKSDNFVCSICSAKFSNHIGLRVHHSICKRQVLECEKCLRKFRDRHELVLHQQIHSRNCKSDVTASDLEKCHCDICNMDFYTNRSYRMHMGSKHRPEGAPLFRCEECNKDFKTKFTLRQHMVLAARHLKPESFRFQCDRCSMVFVRKLELIEHLQVHTNELLYRCTICDRGFSRKPSLWRHTRYMHGGPKANNHKCPICEKSFNAQYKLLVHIRSHTGQKPFVCDVCGSGFTSNCTLKQHIRGVHQKKWPKRDRRLERQNKKSISSEALRKKEQEADDLSIGKKHLQVGKISHNGDGESIRAPGIYRGPQRPLPGCSPRIG